MKYHYHLLCVVVLGMYKDLFDLDHLHYPFQKSLFWMQYLYQNSVVQQN